mgnify:CR=1 FL=1
MKIKFLKVYIGLCFLFAFTLFVAIEYSFPIDIVAYVSNLLNRSEINTKLWLQAVSLLFLWFAGLFGLILFSETPTKAENTKNKS